jgi:hypothetical protein
MSKSTALPVAFTSEPSEKYMSFAEFLAYVELAVRRGVD